MPACAAGPKRGAKSDQQACNGQAQQSELVGGDNWGDAKKRRDKRRCKQAGKERPAPQAWPKPHGVAQNSAHSGDVAIDQQQSGGGAADQNTTACCVPDRCKIERNHHHWTKFKDATRPTD